MIRLNLGLIIYNVDKHQLLWVSEDIFYISHSTLLCFRLVFRWPSLVEIRQLFMDVLETIGMIITDVLRH